MLLVKERMKCPLGHDPPSAIAESGKRLGGLLLFQHSKTAGLLLGPVVRLLTFFFLQACQASLFNSIETILFNSSLSRLS